MPAIVHRQLHEIVGVRFSRVKGGIFWGITECFFRYLVNRSFFAVVGVIRYTIEYIIVFANLPKINLVRGLCIYGKQAQ